jgi:plastocyanin
MTNLAAFQLRPISLPRQLALLIALTLPISALAENWQVQVGAQTGDKAHQALAFLPNELWIRAGDTITWTFPTSELHSVTFLTQGQIRPSRLVGCPGTNSTPNFSVVDGTACVNSGILMDGATYTVVFQAIGNFKAVCLAHNDQTGTIHVLAPSAPLPHDQAFYNQEANRQRAGLISDARNAAEVRTDYHTVIAGAGKIHGTSGGTQTASVMRFMDETKVIHVGETVEWTTSEAVTNHTITFGPEPDPANQIPPSSNVTVDADGARHAYISSTSDVVHSGFITQAPQDRIGLAQAPLGVTRFRVTFTQAGTYPYICVLHDNLGMVGKVIVLP